jgi:hypothetical protein
VQDADKLRQYYADLGALHTLAPILSEAASHVMFGGSKFDNIVWTGFFAQNYDNATAMPASLVAAAMQLKQLQDEGKGVALHNLLLEALEYIKHSRASMAQYTESQAETMVSGYFMNTLSGMVLMDGTLQGKPLGKQSLN